MWTKLAAVTTVVLATMTAFAAPVGPELGFWGMSRQPPGPGLECATGKIAVHLKNGTFLGYVSKRFVTVTNNLPGTTPSTTTIGIFGPTNHNASDALLVTLPSTSFAILSSPFNLYIDNAPDTTHPWLGAALMDSGSPLLGSGKSGSAAITSFSSASPEGPPTHPSSYGGTAHMGESKIWRLTSTREFRPLWVNGDGTSDAASFWYFASAQQVHPDGVNAFGISGDRVAVGNANLVTLVEVKFSFAPCCYRY